MSEPKFRRYAPEVRAGMLVEAGMACLARGGITAFTVDNICREAGASRGLITHHFGGKDGLLAAVYAAAYAPMLERWEGVGLAGLMDRLFDPAQFAPPGLTAWLALWGEIAVNPVLQAEHARHYAAYRTAVAGVLRSHAPDPETLAGALIALADGLWLEQCLAPDLMSPDRAKAACRMLLTPILGPF